MNPMCGKYTSDEVLPNGEGNCSLCNSPMNEAGECLYHEKKSNAKEKTV